VSTREVYREKGYATLYLFTCAKYLHLALGTCFKNVGHNIATLQRKNGLFLQSDMYCTSLFLFLW